MTMVHTNVPRKVLSSGSRAVSSDSSHGSISGQRSSSSSANSLAGGSSVCSGTTTAELPHEQLALVQLAHRLGAVVQGVDVKNGDAELKEARLLMSLSCASPLQQEEDLQLEHPSSFSGHEQQQEQHPLPHDCNQNQAGRITPQSLGSSSLHSAASGNSNSRQSRRDSFQLTCPSLSLAVTQRETVRDTCTTAAEAAAAAAAPALMLGRTLKVADVNALRLSSEAMARNVMMSFQKAMEWRMQSWVNALTQVLLQKEQDLHQQYYYQQGDLQRVLRDETQKLLCSDEALLVAALRESQDKIEVIQASTTFKVLQRVASTGSATGTGVVSINDDVVDGEVPGAGHLQEGEYVYDVVHLLEMQSTLSIATPAGCVTLNVNVPGRIKGLFLSVLSADDDTGGREELTNVKVSLNTGMLASMIDKGSRVAVRASVEALLKGEHVIAPKADEDDTMPSANAAAAMVQNLKTPVKNVNTTVPTTMTDTPTRAVSQDSVSGLVVVTPRDASSLSTFADSSSSDSEDSANAANSTNNGQPVNLQIPDNFNKRSCGTVLFPQTTRFPPMKKARSSSSTSSDVAATTTASPSNAVASMVTPLKTNGADRIATHERGPNLPILVDAACAQREAKKD